MAEWLKRGTWNAFDHDLEVMGLNPSPVENWDV